MRGFSCCWVVVTTEVSLTSPSKEKSGGPASSLEKLLVLKWGSLPALVRASVTRLTAKLCEVEACTLGADIAILSLRSMYAVDGS